MITKLDLVGQMTSKTRCSDYEQPARWGPAHEPPTPDTAARRCRGQRPRHATIKTSPPCIRNLMSLALVTTDEPPAATSGLSVWQPDIHVWSRGTVIETTFGPRWIAMSTRS